MNVVLAYFGFPGGAELLIVAFIILILFGSRLPNVMRSLGQGITEFKKGVKGIEEDIEESAKIKDESDS